MGFLGDLLGGGAEGLLKGAGSLAKDIRTAITGETSLTSEAKATLDGKLIELDAIIAQLGVEVSRLQHNIIIAETKSQSWLAFIANQRVLNYISYSLTTFSAAGPFGPSTMSKPTRCPSSRDLNPSP